MVHRTSPIHLAQSRAASRFLALGVAVALAFAGCAGETTVGLVLLPSDDSMFNIEGSNPFVIVDNSGPGDIKVLFTLHDAVAEAPEHVLRGSVARNLRGGGNLRIINESRERADIKVTIKNHTGVTMDRPSGVAPVE